MNKQDKSLAGQTSKQDLELKIKDIANNFHTKPEELAEYLKFSSKFYQYSVRNTMLIYQQNEGALFCGSFKKFKDMGYFVRKGQHGMKILVPTKKTVLRIGDKLVSLSQATKEQKAAYKRGEIEGKEWLVFKVGTVFDITQTNIPQSDYPKYLGIGVNSEQHKELYDLLVKYNNEKLGVSIRENQLQSVALRGYYNPKENDITISENFNDTARVSILSHETGHAMLHHNKAAAQRPNSQIEFEADCFSIMFCTYAGIEIANTRNQHLVDNFNAMTNHKDYKPDMLQQSLDRAHNAFKELVDYVNPVLFPDIPLDNNPLNVPTQAPSSASAAEPILPNQIPDIGGFSMCL